ncbi:MAG TPA: SDR family NAD(P)-dependent oxidoreductase [Puia sp.]|jgi:short-subunit dehydrogenase|nr:SDR family NAD(P)-dependent oxidoreductase [Puia sp.]
MSWALVAGGSKGIGFSIAEALAKRKYNLLLVARNHDDLILAKKTLEKTYPVEVETLTCDLSLTESTIKIHDWCNDKGCKVNILCNVAGSGGSGDFPELPVNEVSTMLRTNLESTIALSTILIPQLKTNAPSYILNVGSLAGFAPILIKSVYASAKSAVHSFSYSLRYILKPDKISVSCLCPGPVFTKPSIVNETMKQMGWLGKHMALEPGLVGELAIRGLLRRKMIIVPGKLARLISYILRILPDQFIAYLIYSFRK